jgi:hypothetical protein
LINADVASVRAPVALKLEPRKRLHVVALLVENHAQQQ